MAESHVTQEAVLDALSKVQDPDLHRSIVSLGMVQNLSICDGNIRFELVLTTTACPLKENIKQDAYNAVAPLPGVKSVQVEISGRTLAAKVPERQMVPGVKNIIAVSSGKGGVGKSTVAVNLACALAKRGASIGIVDADIYGPNVPIMMGLRKAMPTAQDNKMLPPENHGVKVMSMGFMVKEDQPVVWRGPLLDKVIRQFISDTLWGDLDYLFIDLPPGTGDAQLTIVQAVPVTGAVIVTTPQGVALHDSRKGLQMFRNANIPVLGIIENMSYHLCAHCGERDEIFGHGGGKLAADELQVPFLGAVPIMTALRRHADEGRPIVVAEPESEQTRLFEEIASNIVAQICEMGTRELLPV